MTNPDDSKPKIIVDDDWKTQVQAEKAALKEQEAQEQKENSKKDDAPADDTAAAVDTAEATSDLSLIHI